MTTKPSTISSKDRLLNPRAIPQKLSQHEINNAGAEIPVGAGPITVVFSREGDLAFVLNNRESSVTVIDVKLARAIKTIEVGVDPRGASASPNGRDVVVCHGGSASVIECSTLEVRAVIEGVSTIVSTPFSPDGRYIYFCSLGEPEVVIVDSENFQVVDRISLEGHPDVFSIVLNPSKPLAYISSTITGEVWIFNTVTWVLIKKVKVGQGPTGLAISSDGKLLVACNFHGDTVSFISINDDAVVGTVDVGSNPIAAVFSPDGRLAYIADGGGDTLSVIDTENFQKVEVLSVGQNPFDVAINPEGTRVYVANVGSGSVSVLDVGPSEVVEDFESVEPQ
jgi:YVTN family beta-propeller protein